MKQRTASAGYAGGKPFSPLSAGQEPWSDGHPWQTRRTGSVEGQQRPLFARPSPCSALPRSCQAAPGTANASARSRRTTAAARREVTEAGHGVQYGRPATSRAAAPSSAGQVQESRTEAPIPVARFVVHHVGPAFLGFVVFTPQWTPSRPGVASVRPRNPTAEIERAGPYARPTAQRNPSAGNVRPR